MRWSDAGGDGAGGKRQRVRVCPSADFTVLSRARYGAPVPRVMVIGGDGQVSLGNTVMKGNARKVRRLYHDKVLAGFAGGTADS